MNTYIKEGRIPNQVRMVYIVLPSPWNALSGPIISSYDSEGEVSTWETDMSNVVVTNVYDGGCVTWTM